MERVHPIRYVKIYLEGDIYIQWRRFGNMWEDTQDSATLIPTQVLCRLVKKYSQREDIIQVKIDDKIYNKEILNGLY